jgi:hypothetical protein
MSAMPQLSLRNPPCLCGKNQPWLDEIRARFMSALPTEFVAHRGGPQGGREQARADVLPGTRGPVDRYEVKSQCIGDVFQRFALDGRHVNGNYPMDEDIADSGGIRFSYEDFTTQQPRSLAGKRMFFTALAWCSVERKKAVV